jgi:3-methyladenine DNA glycosylase AlkC
MGIVFVFPIEVSRFKIRKTFENMKADIKQLKRDIKAAVMINKTEAFNLALDGLLLLPGVSSNDPMSSSFMDQVIFPVGEMLSELPPDQLKTLLTHNLAAGRAIGSVALAHHYAYKNDTSQADITYSANDPRSEVRLALAETLEKLTEHSPERILKLGKQWIKMQSPRLRITALKLFPKLITYHDEQIFNLLQQLNKEDDKNVKAEMVNTLNHIARAGSPTFVLNLLSSWSEEKEPNTWVICRTLTASCLSSYQGEIKFILRKIQPKTQENNLISNTLKALKQHGIEIML